MSGLVEGLNRFDHLHRKLETQTILAEIALPGLPEPLRRRRARGDLRGRLRRRAVDRRRCDDWRLEAPALGECADGGWIQTRDRTIRAIDLRRLIDLGEQTAVVIGGGRGPRDAVRRRKNVATLPNGDRRRVLLGDRRDAVEHAPSAVRQPCDDPERAGRRRQTADAAGQTAAVAAGARGVSRRQGAPPALDALLEELFRDRFRRGPRRGRVLTARLRVAVRSGDIERFAGLFLVLDRKLANGRVGRNRQRVGKVPRVRAHETGDVCVRRQRLDFDAFDRLEELRLDAQIALNLPQRHQSERRAGAVHQLPDGRIRDEGVFEGIAVPGSARDADRLFGLLAAPFLSLAPRLSADRLGRLAEDRLFRRGSTQRALQRRRRVFVPLAFIDGLFVHLPTLWTTESAADRTRSRY